MVVTSREKLSLCQQKNKKTNKARKQAHHKINKGLWRKMRSAQNKQESRTQPPQTWKERSAFITHQRRKTRRAPKQGTHATKTTAFFQLSKKWSTRKSPSRRTIFWILTQTQTKKEDATSKDHRQGQTRLTLAEPTPDPQMRAPLEANNWKKIAAAGATGRRNGSNR
jgi:hypothetical protein